MSSQQDKPSTQTSQSKLSSQQEEEHETSLKKDDKISLHFGNAIIAGFLGSLSSVCGKMISSNESTILFFCLNILLTVFMIVFQGR